MKTNSLYSVYLILTGGILIGCSGPGQFHLGFLEHGSDAQGDEAAEIDTASPETVVVHLVNASSHALDVQFHVTTDVAVRTEDDLFKDDSHSTEGIGFLAQGVLAPFEAAIRVFECGEALTVGTAGGLFLDAHTGDLLAAGQTSRFAAMGPQFDCGATITFRFNVDVDGRPNPILSIE